ncbi:EamA family transporter [Nocardioides donggukensis]|uniref:EamA family transporter n=1 Tax=Nocardioides donggukensis TaxID=2774019 RepID=A0A927Q2Y3_9ACTN|nr:EamA family transporter [Nocardioides donggukensis]MBD8870076.1 EamA family transporter [Nocardioides donggukensis]
MTTLTHDTGTRLASGTGFALLSAISFGLSGALARGLMDAGWSAGSAVTVRVLGGAFVLAVPAVAVLRGRWALLWRSRGLVVGYGVLAVSVTQLCYFYAVAEISVSVALLLEYTAPVAVVGWLWATRGHRPSRLTVAGAVLAAAGLVLVLDLVSGADVNLAGVLWSLGAMVGAAAYFLLSADDGAPLPPLVLAASGLLVGGLVLSSAGALGVLPMRWSTRPVTYAVGTVPWWLPLLALALVTAALSYTTGIAAVRRLGSRLASFVALTEVLAALLAAWWLLHELPGLVQLAGGLLIVAGVVVVKLGERGIAPAAAPVPETGGEPAPALGG